MPKFRQAVSHFPPSSPKLSWISPQFLPFSIFVVVAQRAKSSRLLASALVVGLYTLKGKGKNQLYSSKPPLQSEQVLNGIEETENFLNINCINILIQKSPIFLKFIFFSTSDLSFKHLCMQNIMHEIGRCHAAGLCCTIFFLCDIINICTIVKHWYHSKSL